MSYSSIWACAQDRDLRNRVTACAQTLDISPAGAESWVNTNMLAFAATPNIAAAWEYSAGANPYHARRGYDPAIITDDMVLAAVRGVSGASDGT